MTRISSAPARRGLGAKRPDLSDLKQALADNRVELMFGKVYKPADAEAHFRIVAGDGGQTDDVLVEVETFPTRQDLSCRLPGGFGGAGAGLWAVPPIGTEVIVGLPDGELDFMPTIVAVLSSGLIPARAGTDRTVLVSRQPLEIIAPSVTITDTEGGGALATKADLDALRNYIQTQLTLPVSGATAGPIAAPPAPMSAGTQILRAR